MSVAVYVLGVVAALLVIAAIIELLRRSTLRERHAVWWLAGGLIALIVAIFPGMLVALAGLLGVTVPANLAFFVALGLLFLVSLQYGAELTRTEDRLRSLAERTAFLEERLRSLEQIGTDRGAVDGPDHEADDEEAGSRRPGERDAEA